MKKYDILDVTKIVLSIMVVAIHTRIFPTFLYPWLRLAVPLFFVISSWLLFNKIKNSPKEAKTNIIRHYIIRILKMYLFWFIVLLPVTIYARRNWFDQGFGMGIANTVLQTFFGSTFYGSWYLMSSIIGVVVVDKLTDKFSMKVAVTLCIISYIVCTLASGYSFLLKFNNTYGIIIEPQFSFLASLIYILLGKIFSMNKININKKINVFLLIISCILLFCEWFIIYKITGRYDHDCYLMIAPLAMLIFNQIKDIKIDIKTAKLLRQLSSFIYPLHISLSAIVKNILLKFISDSIVIGIINFITTLLICIAAFIIVKKTEKYIKVLKYSY